MVPWAEPPDFTGELLACLNGADEFMPHTILLFVVGAHDNGTKSNHGGSFVSG